MEIFNAYLHPVILGICLVCGYIIKHWLPDVDNKIIPTVVTVLGILLSLWISGWHFTPEILLTGALTGLASTGMHQLLKQWLEPDSKA